jgi:hypothetical protein
MRVEKGEGPICRNGPEGASHKLDLSPFSTLETRARRGSPDPAAVGPKVSRRRVRLRFWRPPVGPCAGSETRAQRVLIVH